MILTVLSFVVYTALVYFAYFSQSMSAIGVAVNKAYQTEQTQTLHFMHLLVGSFS